jgi:enamine deaminase RidA (YjgF/YER057c/UK114 family)
MDVLHPAGWPRPPGFSNGIAASGRHVFVAGQIGTDPVGKGFPDASFAGQARQALANVVAVLAEAGAGPEHITRLNWFVTDLDAYKAGGREIGQAYRETVGKSFPAMTMVEVSRLLVDGALVEIEAHAVVPE